MDIGPLADADAFPSRIYKDEAEEDAIVLLATNEIILNGPIFFWIVHHHAASKLYTMVAFCEKNATVMGVHQPVNAISGLVFLFAAFKLFERGRVEYGLMLVALAITTFGMHATDNKNDFWGRADMASMWAIVLTSLLHNLGANELAPYIVLIAVLLCMRTNALKLPAFIAIAAAWIVSFLPRFDAHIAMGYAWFAFSLGCWLLDIHGYCNPHSPMQLHALWHIGSAIGFCLLLP